MIYLQRMHINLGGYFFVLYGKEYHFFFRFLIIGWNMSYLRDEYDHEYLKYVQCPNYRTQFFIVYRNVNILV